VWDLGAEHADWLSSRSILFQPLFFKVCCGACSKSCLLFESTMKFKKYNRWTGEEVQDLLSLYVEDEIQRELESCAQSYVTRLNLHGTLDRDGNTDSNRSGGEKVPGANCSG